MTRLEEIRADDASYEDDDDVRALRAIGGPSASQVVADRRWLLARVDELAAALRMQPGKQFETPCFCRTAANTYCVGQPVCRALNAALNTLDEPTKGPRGMTPTERSARRAAIRAARERAAKATPNDWRNRAYYYSFTLTGVPAIDRILSAVACAGKAFHHTDQWGESVGSSYGDHLRGDSPAEWIQNAATDAAAELRTDIPLLADDADRYHDLVERVEALRDELRAQKRKEETWRAHSLKLVIADRLEALLPPGEPS